MPLPNASLTRPAARRPGPRAGAAWRRGCPARRVGERSPGQRGAPPPGSDIIAGLPAPLADGTDPAAGYLAALGGLEPAQQAQALLGAVTGDAGVAPAVAGSQETRLAQSAR